MNKAKKATKQPIQPKKRRSPTNKVGKNVGVLTNKPCREVVQKFIEFSPQTKTQVDQYTKAVGLKTFTSGLHALINLGFQTHQQAQNESHT